MFKSTLSAVSAKSSSLMISLVTAATAAMAVSAPTQAATIGGVNFGNTLDYLLIFTDGSQDANWQGASKGFSGDVAVNGLVASERTSGTVPYAGTIYTNDTTAGAWNNILTSNSTQASVVTGATSRISGLVSDVNNVFTQINALSATAGYTSRSSTSLNGLNTQNGIAENFVINITSGLSVSSQINITGDANDAFILRWDSDTTTAGYQGQTKFQSGGGIIPLGGLTAGNFFNVAGDINSSGGGSFPTSVPKGPIDPDTGVNVIGGQNFNGGGLFTGYWYTTGSPTNAADLTHSVAYGNSSSLSNAIFTGGWFSINNKFSMTSGTSGVYVAPNAALLTTSTPPAAVPEPLTILGAATAAGFGASFKRRLAKAQADKDAA